MEKNINLYDKNNELVAQFLGLNIITDGISLFDTNYKPLAKYHESWNDLMPVVEKIERLDNADYVVIIQDDTCTIYGREFKITVDEYSKIESTYKACVEFINWYNKTLK